MAWQKHLINKQVLELEIPSKLEAIPLQNQVAGIFRDEMVPIIEKVCTQLTQDPETLRIDRLQLDLGAIRISNIKEEFVERFEAELRQQLSGFLESSREKSVSTKQTEQHSDLELIAFYLQSGLLPWWAKNTDQQQLQEKFEQLIHSNNPEHISFIRSITKKEVILKRIFSSFNDHLIDALLKQTGFTKNYEPEALRKDIFSLFQESCTGNLLKKAWRQSLSFLLLNTDRSMPMKSPEIFRAFLNELALQQNISYEKLISQKLLPALNKLSQPLKYPVREWVQTTDRTIDPQQQNLAALSVIPEFSSQARQLLAMGTATEQARLHQLIYQYLDNRKGLILQIQPSLNKLKQAIDEWLKEVLRQDTEDKRSPAFAIFPQTGNLKTLLTALQNEMPPAAEAINYFELFEQLIAATSLLKDLNKQLSAGKQEHIQSTTHLKALRVTTTQLVNIVRDCCSNSHLKQLIDDSAQLSEYLTKAKTSSKRKQTDIRDEAVFSDIEKVPVSNAGLILFWPFLRLFFQNLELLEDGHFIDEDAQQKAIAALQYLAYGENEGTFFEAELPLNKTLCGMDLFEPVSCEIELTPEEKEIADGLISAVIQKHVLWQNISPEGFRKAYLQREGLLSTRDGNWLLQVKRETYDIIIDQLPWSLQLIKLPWMEALMSCEWQEL